MHSKSIVMQRGERSDFPLLVYYLKLSTTTVFLHDGTLVHCLPIIFFGDRYQARMLQNQNVISVMSEKLSVKCTKKTSDLIGELRERLNWLLEYKVSHPGCVDWTKDCSETNLLR